MCEVDLSDKVDCSIINSVLNLKWIRYMVGLQLFSVINYFSASFSL